MKPVAEAELNAQQAAAVAVDAGPVLVLAGAGTGKTRVLTHRIARLLHGGVNPGRIFAATFTNRAADQMRERVARLAPQADLRGLWLGTFHGLCARLLRAFPGEFGIQGQQGKDREEGTFTICTEEDQGLLLQGILDDLGNPARIGVADVAAYISAVKNEVIPAQAPEARLQAHLELLLQARARYDAALASCGALDFDDLVGVVRAGLRDRPATRAFCQTLFDHVLVDEFQDTNRAQYEIVRALAGPDNHLFVVGDDDQSIYAFRGADVGHILRFPQDYPAARIIRLEHNYRSGGRILDAANAVIARNAHRHGKQLWTDRPGQGTIVGVQCPSALREAHWVAQQVRRLVDRGPYNWKDLAVLYRNHAQGDPVELVLGQTGIGYRRPVRGPRAQHPSLRPLVLLLRAAVNPRDAQSLDGLRAWRAAVDGQLEAGCGQGPDLVAAVEQVRSSLSQRDAPGCILGALEAAGSVRRVLEADGASRCALAKLIEEATRFAADHEDGGLAAFLHQGCLLSAEGRAEDGHAEDGNAVQLLTVHGAKGLEFPVVFVLGMEEGLFPPMRQLEEARRRPGQIEEERRLFYVALTRAKERVFLSFCAQRSRMEGLVCNGPSRFLREIPGLRKTRLPADCR